LSRSEETIGTLEDPGNSKLYTFWSWFS